jgi:hypothetical protein
MHVSLSTTRQRGRPGRVEQAHSCTKTGPPPDDKYPMLAGEIFVNLAALNAATYRRVKQQRPCCFA